MAEGGLITYACDICGQDNLTEADMKSHMLLEHVEGEISCPFCDLDGTTVDEMTWHINAEHLDAMTPTKIKIDHFSATETFMEGKDSSESSVASRLSDISKADDKMEDGSDTSESASEQRYDCETSLITKFKDDDQVKRRAKLHLNVTVASPRKKIQALLKNDTVKCCYMETMQTGKDIQMIRIDDELTPVRVDKVVITTTDPNGNSGLVAMFDSGLDMYDTVPDITMLDDNGSMPENTMPYNSMPNNSMHALLAADSPAETYSCPLCDWSTRSPGDITRHVNVRHLDLLSPATSRLSSTTGSSTTCTTSNTASTSLTIAPLHGRDSENNIVHQTAAGAPEVPERVARQQSRARSPSVPACPFCALRIDSAVELELHVNTKHLDLLSPAGGGGDRNYNAEDQSSLQSGQTLRTCPVCGMEDFEPYSLAQHVDGHFSADTTPVTDEISDNMLAQNLERTEFQAQRYREQQEFETLQAVYGMDNKTDFLRQSEKNMERAVNSGQMTISDYYTRRLDLQQASALGVDDGHSCTRDILPKLQEFYNYNNNSNCSNISRYVTCSLLDHYASTYGDKGWGCGYRNLQMLLSCLARNSTYRQVLFNSRAAIPSIPKMQRLIEAAWKKGFDLQGCEQLGGKVLNTNKWIGATEVMAMMSSLKIKCRLIDFHAPTGTEGTHPKMFDWVREHFSKETDFRTPLYLQHHGHSRTIVGMEELKDASIKMLIFDPIYTKQQMQQFRNGINANMMRTIRRTIHSMKAKQYQIVSVVGVMTDAEYDESKIIKSERFS